MHQHFQSLLKDTVAPVYILTGVANVYLHLRGKFVSFFSKHRLNCKTCIFSRIKLSAKFLHFVLWFVHNRGEWNVPDQLHCRCRKQSL